MTLGSSFSLLKLGILTLLLIALAFAFRQTATFWPIDPVWPNGHHSPYGYHPNTHTGEEVTQQDFAVHFNYFVDIWHRTQPHPYQLADQEKIMRSWNPALSGGMPHAYSPVGLCLIEPLLSRPAWQAYLLYLLFTFIEIVVLVCFYLAPRAVNSFQLLLLISALLNWSFLSALYMGQTSLYTTGFLALLWFLLQKRSKGQETLGTDVIMALLIWALCAKPSVGLVGLFLALGCQAWRAFFFAGGLLVLTWFFLADRYGGWWSGLQDYLWLLNHYYHAALTPYFRDSLPLGLSTNLNAFFLTFFPQQEAASFLLSRLLYLGLSLLCLGLSWSHRLTRSELFQSLVWVYLLFSPHLLVAEDWLICLLLVEGNFFRPAPGMALKALCLIVLLNQRVPYPALLHLSLSNSVLAPYIYCQIGYLAKVILAFWWLVELMVKKSAPSSGEKETPSFAVTS